MSLTLNQMQRFTKRFRERGGLAERLAGLLFERAAPELLEQFEPDTLTALGRGALAFLESPGDLKVRVYNPEFGTHGWTAPYTVLELALPDRPFIVDSVRTALRRRGLEPQHVLHPVVNVVRENGKITELADAAPSSSGERLAYELFFVAPSGSKTDRDALEAAVRDVLNDVLLATRDHHAMRTRAAALGRELGELADAAEGDYKDELLEYAALLDWLTDDHFVFLGYREYDILEHEGVPSLRATPGSGLGILSKPSSAYEAPTPLADLQGGLRERVLGGRVVTVSKTNAEATVHRGARMDYLGIKRLGGGAVVGERRFVGLWTSKALAAPVEAVPVLRRKLRLVLELDGAEPGSHDFKALVSVFGSLPRDELFWSDAPRLLADIRTVMAGPGGVRLTLRPDPLARGVAVMVIMPRERFNAPVRRRVQAYLAKELAATHTDYQLAMGDDEEGVRLHFFFSTPADYRGLSVGALETGVAALTRTWDDRLGDLLRQGRGRVAGGRLAARYLGAFDERYRADTAPETALRDVERLESLASAPFVVNLLNPHDPAHTSQQGLGREASHLEVYHRGRTLVLSDVLPLLENLGLRVLEQVSYTFGLKTADLSTEERQALGFGETAGDFYARGLDIFRVQDAAGQPLTVERDGDRLRAALTALLTGEAENDRLNRLVLSAGLGVRQVALLRTLNMVAAQLSPSVSRTFIADAMLNHPGLAARLMELFELKFAPGVTDREASLEAAQASFDEGLQAVSSLAEDGALRALADLVGAAVRTNYFLDKPYISLKLESARVAQMPEPRPLFEIAVAAPHVEGVHLRGGRVARGGLRWSDRPDDFRTEVLGLMKTQTTKNAVIVPVGSKGGFVLKGAPTDRDALQTFVREQYQTYLRGLLDLTDNLVNGQVVHPAGLVIYDPPDPYLVVAADKGTATFSDLANEVAAEYGFWLGDAFASGGSRGYDHKAEGITARGAWEGVKRHFLELGVDVLKEPVTAFGVGDMSGDVFGNGLLYTRTIKLQAAFNHLHIFLDPNPDPEASYAERERLFRLPRSSWEDYNRARISEGGGVFSRTAKSVPLSPQVRAMLGVDAAALSGQDLVRAILKMPADLFWNGGVGTYVKASFETHAEVGDSSNNAVRADAGELRVRVVGEGGNLGFTQRGRVEYALAGGRLNTDAVDNSAGVDMSDHEVNLKIALGPLVENGALSETARNDLLKEMTAEISALVLNDNAQQALALSLAQRRAERDPALFASLQDYLAERGGLRPDLEALPSTKTALTRPYTRPELAVLMAYTKLGLSRRLLETDFPDEPHFQRYLHNYFPKALRERFPEAIAAHPLRREIIAAQFTNTVVGTLGVSFVHRALRQTGSSPAAVVRASLVALELLAAPKLAADILGSGADTDAQYAELDLLSRAVEAVVSWLLRGGVRVDPLPAFMAAYQQPLQTLRRDLGDLLVGEELKRFEVRLEGVQGTFAPTLAADLASLAYLPGLLGAVRAAERSSTDLVAAARGFYALSDRLSLGALRDALLALPTRDKWEKVALGGLVIDLRRVQLELCVRFLKSGERTLEAFFARHEATLRRYDATLAEVQADDALGLASGGVLRGVLEELLAAA